MDKEVFISIRLASQQKEQFGRAAKSAGKTVAAWLRDLGAAAIAPPLAVGPSRSPQYVENAVSRIHAEQVEDKMFGPLIGPSRSLFNPDKPVPLERIHDAISSSLGEDVATAYAPKVLEHAAGAEAPIGRSVTDFLMSAVPKVGGRGLFNPEHFLSLCGGEFRPPKGWGVWDVKKRAAWLDANRPLEAK